jgi:hypothetical protein
MPGAARASIVAVLASVLLLPVTVRVYYRFKKSGLVVWVREGIAVYSFIDRKRMRIANQLHRSGMALRDERLRSAAIHDRPWTPTLWPSVPPMHDASLPRGAVSARRPRRARKGLRTAIWQARWKAMRDAGLVGGSTTSPAPEGP